MNFADTVNKIRNAIYGKDVRSSIADGIETVYNRQNEAIDIANTAKAKVDANDGRIDNLVNAPEGKDLEVQDLKFDSVNNIQYASAGARVNKINSDLTERAKLNATFANAKDRLMIVNYLGNTENIHPKVLYFENKFAGWYYWMAYTPYPSANTADENPCIAVSNDGVNWREPIGLTNPIAPKYDLGYNSDTHLVINGSTLECWWRRYNTTVTPNTSQICRMTSLDGITWTPIEVMLDSTSYGKDILSPAIIYDGSKYCLWGVSNNQIIYNESVNGFTWIPVNERTISVDFKGLIPWHLDVIKTTNGYEIVLQGYYANQGNNYSSMYYLQSSDNITYTSPILILEPSKAQGAWDDQGIYRASAVKVGDTYRLYYSAVARNNKRAISFAAGDSLVNLKGYANTGVLALVYTPQDNMGYYLPKSDIQPSSLGKKGSYIQSSKELDYTARVVGDKLPDKSGGFQVAYLYLDEGTEASLQGLTIKPGALRKNGEYIEFYNSLGWRKLNNERTVQTITAPQTLAELDITDKRLIVINGTGTVVIQSIIGGDISGEETAIMIDATNAVCQINDSSTVITPGRSGVTLDSSKVACKIRRMASTRWRIY